MLALSNEAKIISDLTRATGVKYSEEQLDILRNTGGMCILACAGSGKALKNGTGVLTPSGYVPIESLRVGDTCYDAEGKEQTVEAVFPQGKKEVYRVIFSDRTVIECCKDHLWTYQTYNLRRTTKEWKTDTLENILNSIPIRVYLSTNVDRESHDRANIYIPMTKAVQFEGKALPIKPYLMGALLGDKCIKSNDGNGRYSFSNLDKDTYERINSMLNSVGAWLTNIDDEANCRISVGIGYGHNNREGLITQIMGDLGLIATDGHTKFIPDIYKYASVENRLELLRGLMDTDGHCGGSYYEITLGSEQLVEDTKFVVETLGMTAVKSEREVTYNNVDFGTPVNNTVYKLCIKVSEDIPKIHWSKRRESQWKTGQTSARRTIEEIVKTGEYAEMTCIKVSSASGLFLTENCVVTHNTTILTHLLAKRVISGEIADTSKLLCTTYSRAGATEMDDRLKKLFNRLGMKSNMTVKTLHAFYKMVLSHFGFPTDVISGKMRLQFLTASCKDARVSLGDEDLQLIDSLLSYQVNNLMSDEAIVKSYVYTLDNVTQEQYTSIRMGYTNRKQEAGLIDFDDMQLYMYTCLVQGTRPDMLAYCRNKWTDFYIDEAQDVSKIQFAILRMLMMDHNKITFIGDDDQCLIEGTVVVTNRGRLPIEQIEAGDEVLSGIGRGKTRYVMVDNISKKRVTEDIVVIKTRSGRELRGTSDHTGFARLAPNSDSISPAKSAGYILKYTMFNSDQTDEHDIYKSTLIVNSRSITNDTITQEAIIKKIEADCKVANVYLEVDKVAKFNDNKYMFMTLGNMIEGMYVPVLNVDIIKEDEIISVTREKYDGYVYDISVPDTKNFVANGIVVHNCIYQWRGADPSIILDICGYYDIKKAILSTNYRCYGNIVRPAAVGITNNKRRAEKTMKPFNEGGSLKVCDTHGGSLYNQAKYAYEHIRRMVVDDNVPLDHIAVLSRNNQHLAILNSMLFKDGVYCESAYEMRFTQTNMYRDIKNVIELSLNGTNHNITASTLWRVCIYLGVRGSRTIADIQNSSNAKLSDILGYLLTKHTRRNVDWAGSFKLPATADARLENFCQGLHNDTMDYMVYVYKLLAIADDKKRVAGLLGLYLSSTEFMYKSQDRSRSINGMVDYTLDLINKLGLYKLKAFFRASEQFESGKMIIPGPKVCMCTMHGSKGREWEHVVLFADDNVTFPSFEGIVTMNKNGVHINDISGSLDENRRLHYVAMTRAKSDLTIFTDSDNVSVYALEALGVFTPPQGTSNAHIISMATSGALYDDLVIKAQEMIFHRASPFYYKVDLLKRDNAEDTFHYAQEMNSTSNTGISLDSIQTGQCEYAGKDNSNRGISLSSIQTGKSELAGRDD